MTSKYRRFRKFVKRIMPKWLLRLYVWYRYRLFVIKHLIIPRLMALFGRSSWGISPSIKLREILGDEYGKERLVISLTSFYPRIKRCIPTLKSLLKQNYPNYIIELNLLWDCPVPARVQGFIDKHSDRIRVFRVGVPASENQGHAEISSELSIKKIAYTLRRHPDSYIASCDDDILYHSWWLSYLYYYKLSYDRAGIKNAVVGYCGVFLTDGKLVAMESKYDNPPPKNTMSPVLYFAGGMGVLFEPGMNKKLDLLDHWARCVAIHPLSQYVDDVVIGSWLHCIGYQGHVVYRPFYIIPKAWIPKRTKITHLQEQQYIATGKRTDNIVWGALSEHGLIAKS